MNLTAAEYVQEIWNCRRGLVGWRGLMAAVIAQATVDLVVGGAESAVGQEAERFLASVGRGAGGGAVFGFGGVPVDGGVFGRGVSVAVGAD
jgi:hypothetical protein